MWNTWKEQKKKKKTEKEKSMINRPGWQAAVNNIQTSDDTAWSKMSFLYHSAHWTILVSLNS